MLGIENYRLDIKTVYFKIPSGLFVNCLIFSSNLSPVQVLFYAGASGQDNPVPPTKEATIHTNDDWLRDDTVWLCLSVKIKVLLNRLNTLTVFDR